LNRSAQAFRAPGPPANAPSDGRGFNGREHRTDGCGDFFFTGDFLPQPRIDSGPQFGKDFKSHSTLLRHSGGVETIAS
jgi:hypothetical protein